MTSDRDIERILDHWLTERPTQVADRVLDDVADRIARHPQQPAWRASRRDIHVQTYLKPLLAVAAVIVLAVAGLAVLQPGAGSGVGGPASPSPSASPGGSASPSAAPSAAPSASPSASAVFPAWFPPSANGAGILSAGSHTTKAFVPGFAFTVPEGWVNSSDENAFFALFPDTPANAAEHAASESLVNEIYMGPHGSPWFVCDAWEDNSGENAAEMVTAMLANDALAMSEPIDVTIGGLTGKQFDVQLDPAWTETCPGDPATLDLSDTRTRGFLLDSPDRGVIVIFVGSLRSADHEAFLAEAMPIIESFQFEGAAAPSPS